MAPRSYRLTVIGCVMSWFLVGLHLPTLHQVTHHGHGVPPGFLAALLLLSALAVVGLWALLRAPARR